jgi:hypothetical protein
MKNKRIHRIKTIGSGISIIVFPLMLLAGFLLHPNLLSLERVTAASAQTAEFHHNFIFHFGHLLVLGAVLPVIVSLLKFMGMTRGKGEWYGFIGGVMAVFGAVILAIDKGALTLVLTAFDTLPEEQFALIGPALQVLLDRAGWLFIVWLLPFLPVGAAVQAIGLRKEGLISGLQAWLIIPGLLLLNNPDIEIISTAGAVLMCAGYIPLGIRVLRGEI